MIQAAGILYVTPDRRALFLKRAGAGDHVGEWCFPGGTLEGDETTEGCAYREAIEECGAVPDGERRLWTRAQTGDVDFTTFAQRVKDEFVPTLNHEHDGYAWAPIDQPPGPLHPGCDIALTRWSMDELGVARAISQGRLTSPQFYENVWLFAIRITGTGAAFRHKLKEYVWRDPNIYLNDEFLARCNGLAVIMEHPKGATLDSREFGERTIGSILLPYIPPGTDEVWGIAKVYDAPAATMMTRMQLSTSPAVVFRNPTEGTVKLENGFTLLVEDKPLLLDHIAICEQGVWDKGGEPRGVLAASNGEIDMTPEEKLAAEEKARKDAEEKAKKDSEVRADADKARDDNIAKIASGMDSVLGFCEGLGKRMDAVEARFAKTDADEKEEKEEEKKADAADPASGDEPEKVAADKKAKKDADEKEEADAKTKKDADEKEEKKEPKADSVSKVDLDRALAGVKLLIPRDNTDEDYRSMAAIQERADAVFSALGEHASRPMQGEGLLAYRRRLVGKLQPHSQVWKGTDISKVADDAGFTVIENQIYADAQRAAERPLNLPRGQLRQHVRTDDAGRRISTFHGSSSFVQAFKPQARRIQKVVTNHRDR